MRRRPAGADNFLKLRRSIDDHLELGRMSWNEFAMFVWLCLKASPRTGIVRTGWPPLALQTGLSADRVEQLCRALRRKRYVWYPSHRGRRGRLIELAIDKYPTADGGYTDLSARFAAAPPVSRFAASPTDLPTDLATGRAALPHRATAWPTELGPRPAARTPIPTELDGEMREESRGSPPGRLRKRRERERDREEDRECASARDRQKGQDRQKGRDRQKGQDHNEGQDSAQVWREDLAIPVAIRDLLATQSWWRPPADDNASSSEAGAGGTPDGGRAAATTAPPPGGAPR